MKYKALMLDVDGTTVPNTPEGMPSQRVIDTIAKAKDLIHIGLITGRPLRNVSHIYHHLQLSGPIVLLGGSQIFDPQTKIFLYERPIGKDNIRLLCEILVPYNVVFYIDEKEKSYQFTQDYIPGDPFNIYVQDIPPQIADRIVDEINKKMPYIETHKLVGYLEGKVGINIAHGQATKQHAILEVAKSLNINTQEIIAVGDGYNDFPLLMACGLKIAMGNAVNELKEIADYIAPTVEEDGVAHIIEKFVLST